MEIYPLKINFYLNGEAIIKNDKPYYITNNWISEDQVAKLNYVYDDTAKCYYFFSLDRTPSVLTFDKDYNFTLKDVAYTDGPYLDMNKTSTTLSLSGTTGEVQITASADIFKSNDALLNEGRFIRIAHKGIWGVAQISYFIDAKNVKANTKVAFNGTEATKEFKLGAWGAEQGYPSMATIFSGRMYYGVTNKNKKTIWISKPSDYTNFSPTTRINENNVISDIIAEDNSITLSIPRGKNILWLGSNKDNVLVGSQEGVFTILPFNIEEPISPFNYTVEELNSQKNSRYMVSTDFLTFFVDWHRENIFSISVDKDKLLSLSQINNWSLHLFSSKIKDMLYLDYPSKVLCVLMEDGTLVMGHINYNDEYLNYSWSTCFLSGADTKITAMSTSYDEGNQYLWLATRRKFRGEITNFIEVIKFDSLKNLYIENSTKPIYLDLYVSKKMKNNIITDLALFEGETLTIITVDGSFLGNFTVKDGAITVGNNIYQDSEVFAGYCFDSIYQTPYLQKLDEEVNEVKIDKVNLVAYKSSHIDILNKKETTLQKNILTEKSEGYQNITLNINGN
ncbi:MAG: hypothetical protein LBH40_04205 [Alphaproteobacteria bacterium]|jgi:hypothetical protein|nr:hypothetical protein [Alphaproteobacteria bacterium]